MLQNPQMRKKNTIEQISLFRKWSEIYLSEKLLQTYIAERYHKSTIIRHVVKPRRHGNETRQSHDGVYIQLTNFKY